MGCARQNRPESSVHCTSHKFWQIGSRNLGLVGTYLFAKFLTWPSFCEFTSGITLTWLWSRSGENTRQAIARI